MSDIPSQAEAPTPAPQLLPHSREAEEAVIGAVLINPEAYYDVAQFLRAEDFYIHRHRWVWEAFTQLHEQRTEIDLITVSQKLQEANKLEDVGGMAYLTALINTVPSSFHAVAYGRTVEQNAIRRRMLQAANQIAKLAYQQDRSIDTVIDDIEKAVFDISEHRLTRDLQPIKNVLGDYFDQIIARAQRSEEIHGVPTGFIDLDKLLGGLNPSDLLIVAARPGQGKTGLMLSIAKNAAQLHKKNVAIFSLEMANEQLVQRIIAQETAIDSQRLRTGKLQDHEWGLLTQAIDNLSKTNIFLDDTPGLTPLQLRTKCRRLHLEYGLDLIIIDYLQLMGGDTRNDNRVQEVSYISRSLKVLARELNVPILAAAQLSRAVEQRADKRPQLSDLRESGCLTGDTRITLETGQQVPIRELEGKSGFNIWALNQTTLKLQATPVSRAFSTGIQPVFNLHTRLGKQIRATGNHLFLTIHGWKPLEALTIQDYIALPRIVPTHNHLKQTMSNAELALLGHLIGDGCTLPHHAIQYTTNEKDLAEIVANLASEIFGQDIQPRISPERQWYQVYLSSTRQHTHNTHSAITEWLKQLNAFGLRAHEKRVPAQVFEQPTNAIAIFLRHLWTTDGSIQLIQGKTTRPIAYYATSSPQLAHDVQSLLLRLGINASLRCTPQNGKGRDQYSVIITGKPDLEQFAQIVGTVGAYKTNKLAQVQSYLAEKTANTNRDIIPHPIWRMYVVPAMQQIGMTTRTMQQAIGAQYSGTGLYKQNVSRTRAARVANVVQSPQLTLLAHSDIYWDKITAITPAGEEQVYDLTIPEHHNFVANDIIVHNSLEQDADIVMFIYRPDQYEKDTTKQNVAEIIVAKHRNGPVGSVELIFRSNLAKFENAATKHINLNE